MCRAASTRPSMVINGREDFHSIQSVSSAGSAWSTARTRSCSSWFASDFVTQIERWISQHLLGLLTRGGGADHARPPAWDRPARPPRKAVLVPVAEVRD